MMIAEVQHIPLERCYLCADCQSVGNCSTGCPACASSSVMNLAAVLNPNEKGDPKAAPSCSGVVRDLLFTMN